MYVVSLFHTDREVVCVCVCVCVCKILTHYIVFQLANTYERCDIGTASIDRSS